MAIHQLTYLFDYKRINSLEQFIKDNVKDKVVADCGSGSGIITWLALKYGASKVYCIEKDKDALLHLQAFLYGNNNDVEICNIDYTKDKLPKADIYIHDLFDTHILTADLYGFILNCKKQNITEIYPKNIVIHQGTFHKESETFTPNRTMFDLLAESRVFFKIVSSIYPQLDTCEMPVFDNITDISNDEIIFKGDLFELIDFKFNFSEQQNLWWKAYFDDSNYIDSLNHVQNRCNVGIQKTKDFKSNLRSLLKSQP